MTDVLEARGTVSAFCDGTRDLSDLASLMELLLQDRKCVLCSSLFQRLA